MTEDAGLIQRVVARSQEAFIELHNRYAPLVFHIASRSLDQATAEEVVQDVFLSLWSKADKYDPKKGPFRPWFLQIVHFRILNELRRISRQPRNSPQALDLILAALPDDRFEPVQASWNDFRRKTVREAVESLPHAQKRALSLAFFEELSHDQVAEILEIPLGTVKTRIRRSLKQLRRILAPAGILTALGIGILGLAVHAVYQDAAARSSGQALLLATASNTVELHLSPVGDTPKASHGWYRSRAGTAMAIIALHEFPPAPAGQHYQLWLLRDGTWSSREAPPLDGFGNAVMVAEGPEFLQPPSAIEVRLEPRDAVVIQWRKP